jgi:hypothetical protein
MENRNMCRKKKQERKHRYEANSSIWSLEAGTEKGATTDETITLPSG